MYKRIRGVEPDIHLWVRAGLELGIARFQVPRPNHCATLPSQDLCDLY